MVSIPVDLYSTIQDKDVRFHLIHKSCGSRVRQQKFCPVDERVVTDDEIVRGYETSKGRYVLMEPEDFTGLPVPSLHTVSVSAFVKSDEIDPVFYDSAYFVRPEESGRKPFALLMHAMRERKVFALAQIAMRTRESLCVIRPSGDSMMLETLYYPDEIRTPEGVTTKDIHVDEKELKMAMSLVDLLEETFDPEKYHDEYRVALLDRIHQRAKGNEVSQPVEPEKNSSNVIDIMDALKKSVEAAKKQKKAG